MKRTGGVPAGFSLDAPSAYEFIDIEPTSPGVVTIGLYDELLLTGNNSIDQTTHTGSTKTYRYENATTRSSSSPAAEYYIEFVNEVHHDEGDDDGQRRHESASSSGQRRRRAIRLPSSRITMLPLGRLVIKVLPVVVTKDGILARVTQGTDSKGTATDSSGMHTGAVHSVQMAQYDIGELRVWAYDTVGNRLSPPQFHAMNLELHFLTSTKDHVRVSKLPYTPRGAATTSPPYSTTSGRTAGGSAAAPHSTAYSGSAGDSTADIMWSKILSATQNYEKIQNEHTGIDDATGSVWYESYAVQGLSADLHSFQVRGMNYHGAAGSSTTTGATVVVGVAQESTNGSDEVTSNVVEMNVFRSLTVWPSTLT
eukprot:Lankesteria_metandrocarpae@DN7124_c0_g1_i1.p1